MNQKSKSSQWEIRPADSKVEKKQLGPEIEEDINVELNHKEWPYGHFQPHHEGKTDRKVKKPTT